MKKDNLISINVKNEDVKFITKEEHEIQLMKEEMKEEEPKYVSDEEYEARLKQSEEEDKKLAALIENYANPISQYSALEIEEEEEKDDEIDIIKEVIVESNYSMIETNIIKEILQKKKDELLNLQEKINKLSNTFDDIKISYTSSNEFSKAINEEKGIINTFIYKDNLNIDSFKEYPLLQSLIKKQMNKISKEIVDLFLEDNPSANNTLDLVSEEEE